MVIYYSDNPWCSYENFFDEDAKEANEEEKERRRGGEEEEFDLVQNTSFWSNDLCIYLWKAFNPQNC